MPRKPRKLLKMRSAAIPDSLRYYLETGDYCTKDKFPDCPHKGDTFILACGRKGKLLEAWAGNRDVIIDEWIKTNPCSRPWGWWEFAPEVRRRVGGTGTPDFECLAYKPQYDFGIPSGWLSQDDVKMYGPGLAAVPVDVENPPRFKSEASALLRLNLLTPVEKTYLKKHPELMRDELYPDMKSWDF